MFDQLAALPESEPQVRDDGLVWLERKGLGYLPRFDPGIYDRAYFGKYLKMDALPMGLALTSTRRALVRQFWPHSVVDIGIGGGGFLKARLRENEPTQGYDINPDAVKWLRAHSAYRDPFEGEEMLPAATFWDSLEHIPEPGPLLARIQGFAFVSAPIWLVQELDPGETIRPPDKGWRHYRPGEHVHYWSHRGLLTFMRAHGFDCIHYNDAETAAGRLDIRSYVFLRTKRAPA